MIAGRATTLSLPKEGSGSTLVESAVVDESKAMEVVDLTDSASDPDDPPDGGLDAWLTVVGSFVAHMICYGPEYSYGVYAAYYLQRNLGSASAISLVGAIGAGSINIAGIPTASLMAKFGFQKVVFAGAVFYGLGYFLASFCGNSIPLLCLTQGFIYGVGSSFAYYPAISAPGQWFSKKRGIATGFGMAGSGMGGVLYAFATQQLLDSVGFEWTMRITALFSFVCLAVISPLVKERPNRGDGIAPSATTSFDFSAFKVKTFHPILGCIFFFCVSYYIPSYFLPDYAITQLGVDATNASYLLTAYNTASIVGRIVTGIVGDLVLGRVNTLCCVIVFHALSTVIWVYSTNSMVVLYSFTIVNGFMTGGFWVQFAVAVAEMFGADKMAGNLGILYTTNVLASLVGPTIAGALRDHVSYLSMIWFCGAITAVSAAFAIIARIMFDKMLWKRI
ncbi:major facilitator superfamily domain-containing protein [Obelidium mucronatum]|nr:major facilitator superfamily domain-containing protein [Obelidium mucronatum]